VKTLCTTGILAALLMSSPVLAQDDADKSPLSLEAKLTVPTSYVFRGYVIEEDHALFQPEFTLTFEHEINGVAVSPYIGAWANLTDAPSPGDPEWFNELDVYAGFDVDLGHGFSLGVIYTWYNSPANFFDDIHEVGLTLSHSSDKDWLNPAVGIYRELDNDNGDENTYIELSITPGFDVPKVEGLHLDFPIFVGLTPDDYYTDDDGDGEVIGYLQGGITATYALGEHWSLEAGVDYLYLASQSAQDSNDGDESQIVGRIGVGFNY
jgi:uncharacterized protein (TIGR02001 family)